MRNNLMRLAFEEAELETTSVTCSPNELDAGLVPVDDTELQEAHDDSDKIDALISTTGALENIEEAVQAAGNEDGLGHSTAQALDVAIEQFKLHLGIPDDRRLTMEGFTGGVVTRRMATAVALEEIGETIRRAIKKILEWIKHIARACFDVIERIMRGANAVSERAQKVFRAASALSHGNIHNGKVSPITTSALCSFFNLNGKAMAPQEIVHRYIAFCDDTNKTFNAGKMYAPTQTALREMQRFVNGHGEKSVDMGQVENFASKAVDELLSESLKGYKKVDRSGTPVLVKELPFGNAHLVFSFTKGSTDDTKRVGFSAVVEPGSEAAAELPPMKPQEIMNLMTVITAQMGKGIYRDSKNILAQIRDVSNSVEKECYKLADRQRELGASVVPTLSLIKSISDSSMKLTRTLYAYSGVTTRRLLAYGEQSLAVYRGASANDEPGKALK